MPIHASTILTRSPAALLSYISRLSKTYPGNNTLLFAISPNLPPPELSKVVEGLTTFSARTVGCLSAPVPAGTRENVISCSLAVFENHRASIFRSTIPGRADPQVGRWHAFRKKDEVLASNIQNGKELEGVVDWDTIWSKSTGDLTLPEGLGTLSPSEVDAVIYFSDRAPEGLSNSLAALPSATKLGLIASSTPFITGRPVTLFHNQKIYDSGAVGIALTSRTLRRTVRPRVKFLGVAPISEEMVVTQSEGNMINSLNTQNPTQLLLAAIRKSGMDMETSGSFKEDEKFSLGVLRDGAVSQMYNITAGDPSRGNISLESQRAPAEGAVVQFFHRPKAGLDELASHIPSKAPSLPTVSFLATHEPPTGTQDRPDDPEAAVHVLSNTFLASSENGFVLSRGGQEAEAAWTCTVPGGLVGLEVE